MPLKNLPPEIKKIFDIFPSDSIRLVGGCVRDMIIGITPKDYDFATQFLPQETITILQKHNILAVPTGVKFGTITAVINNQNFEITTLRKDNKADGRHCEPEFVDDYLLDAQRRDFTINALYLDSQGVIYDYFNGIADLENKTVKFIGDANERIKEDFLRILRFFRFSCYYAAKLDNKGLKACIEQKNGVRFLSADRVRNELYKIISCTQKEKLLSILDSLENSQIRVEIFSAQFQIQKLQKLLNLVEALQIKPSENLKFFILIFANNINLDEILSRLNFSNHTKKYFKFLFEKITALNIKSILKTFQTCTTLLADRAKCFRGKHVVEINSSKSGRRASRFARPPNCSGIFASLKRLESIQEFLAFYETELVYDLYLASLVLHGSNNENLAEIKNNLQFIATFSLPNFPINGEDLMTLGIKGKALGEAIIQTKKFWAKNNFTADKGLLIEFAENLK
jgi:poly(A) polymerase